MEKVNLEVNLDELELLGIHKVVASVTPLTPSQEDRRIDVTQAWNAMIEEIRQRRLTVKMLRIATGLGEQR